MHRRFLRKQEAKKRLNFVTLLRAIAGGQVIFHFLLRNFLVKIALKEPRPIDLRYTLCMPVDLKRILFEDQWLLAVEKLGGELVVKGKGKTQKLPLLDFLRKDYPSLSAIHRLDYETSGIVLFAKSKNTLKKIIESKFAGWKKTYFAIIAGAPYKKEADATFPLPARSGDGDVTCVTHYNVQELFRGCAFVELHFERGQRHQIRRHMNMLGHPLILDDLYGNEKINKSFTKFLKLQRFFLHASQIEFPHPISGEMIVVRSPMPKTFNAVLKKLRDAA
jgi:23S rRNA-/tRNA-specific pseudouridylate synthase